MALARFDHAYYRDQYFPLLNALTGDYQILRENPFAMQRRVCSE
jgi:hypothetical protein